MRQALLAVLILSTGCRPAGSLEDARRLLREGDLPAACQTARSLLEGVPAGPSQGSERQLSALRIWIDCLSRRGELAVAERWLSRRPEGDVLRLYGEAMQLVAADSGALPRALERLAQAAERWPKQAEIPYRAAILLLADEDARRALPLLERACGLADTATCAAARAHALLDLGRVEEALREVRRIPRLGPRPEDLAHGRSLIFRVGRRTAAIPDRAHARLQQVREQLDALDRPSEALRLCEELVAEHPRLAVAHTLLGLSHLRLGNQAEAVVGFRRGAELNPSDARNPLFLAVLHETGGRVEESVLSYRRALELDPFLGQAALRLAELLVRLGRIEEARRMLTHARTVQPSLAATIAARLAALRPAAPER